MTGEDASPKAAPPARAPSPMSYRVVTGLYLLAGLAGLVALASGWMLRTRNLYLTACLLGIPVAALFLPFATGARAANSKSYIAVRIGGIGLAFALFLLLSLIGVKMGVEQFMTSVLFCLTASTYLALATIVFLVLAYLARPEETEP